MIDTVDVFEQDQGSFGKVSKGIEEFIIIESSEIDCTNPEV
jgi:hypothetical protein